MEVKLTIPFNKPYLTGKETHYIYQAVQSGKISGDGMFTKKCHAFFEERFGFQKCLLTTSCTDALEMAAILLNIEPGDEVILPSYTFVSTANAFVLRGANLVFVDSEKDNPNMDVASIAALITAKTKAIVPVHYAGMACDMDAIMELANKHQIYVVEDAAQAIDAYYTGKDGIQKPLGSIGHLAAFSFHETKNIMSGEGGMLVINDPQFANRAEVIREKGTNNSIKKIFDKISSVDSDAIEINEEWAFRLGQIGGTDQFNEIEFKIGKDQFKLNPQPIILNDRSVDQNEYKNYIVLSDLDYQIGDSKNQIIQTK
jgi:dTDP-4-amino-4,6-dideoxygalactose transaminase